MPASTPRLYIKKACPYTILSPLVLIFQIFTPPPPQKEKYGGEGGKLWFKGPLIIRFFTEERHMTFCFYPYPPFQKRHENFYENFLPLIHVNWFLCLPLARSDHRATGKCAK